MNPLKIIALPLTLTALLLLPAYSSPSAASDQEKEVRQATAAFYAALASTFAGDVKPMEKVWSHAYDVTYMGPAGGMLSGWTEVSANWKAHTDMKIGGKVETSDLHVMVVGDLAVVQTTETGINHVVDGKVMPTFTIRSTNIFRKENGEWKMVGHHTDPFPGS